MAQFIQPPNNTLMLALIEAARKKEAAKGEVPIAIINAISGGVEKMYEKKKQSIEKAKAEKIKDAELMIKAMANNDLIKFPSSDGATLPGQEGGGEGASIPSNAFIPPKDSKLSELLPGYAFTPKKQAEPTLSPERYTQVLASYKDNPEITKRLTATLRPGMAENDFLREFNNATKIAGKSDDRANLTPEAVDLVGYKFYKTGEMPSLGMRAQALRGRIINRAAEWAKQYGDDAQATVLKQVGYKADRDAFAKLTNIKEQTLSFEKQARKNFEVADKLGKIVDSKGNTIAERWYRKKIKKELLGDKDLKNFDTALVSAMKEYAKVISGGAGSVQALSDSANEEIQGLLDSSESYPAFRSRVDNVIFPEMKNREESYNEQLAEIAARIGGGKKKEPSKQSKPQPSPATKSLNPKDDLDKELEGMGL